MDDTTLAYVAGLFDGEGYVGIQQSARSGAYRTERFRLKVQIGMTHELTIRWLAETFGMTVLIRKPNGRDRRTTSYTADLQARKAATFLRLIQPFVRTKACQVELALRFHESCTSWYASRPKVWGYAPMEEEEALRRRAIYEEMRDLNGRRRGPQTG